MYNETLPENYFDNLYAKVAFSLSKGENTCVSVIQGCGIRTIYNFLETLIKKHGLFSDIFVYSPELCAKDIIEEVKDKMSSNHGPLLVFIPSFEFLKSRADTLFKLDALRRTDYKNVVFLAITDHTAITERESYTAIRSIFFSEMIYVSPFNSEKSEQMIDTLEKYYGWLVPKDVRQTVIELSGGIPRFIKYICKEYSETKFDLHNASRLDHIHQVDFQLRILSKMLISLPEADLNYLGLIEDRKIKSSLLRTYFKNYVSEQVLEIFPYLSATEAKILSYLLESKNKIVSVDKLASIMNMADEDFSLWAIYKKISRLKTKVKNTFQIKNLKGLGYKIVIN